MNNVTQVKQPFHLFSFHSLMKKLNITDSYTQATAKTWIREDYQQVKFAQHCYRSPLIVLKIIQNIIGTLFEISDSFLTSGYIFFIWLMDDKKYKQIHFLWSLFNPTSTIQSWVTGIYSKFCVIVHNFSLIKKKSVKSDAARLVQHSLYPACYVQWSKSSVF